MGELWEFHEGKMAHLATYGLYSHILAIAYFLLILPLLIGSIGISSGCCLRKVYCRLCLLCLTL